MLPSDYKPSSVEDFIGPAKAHAKLLAAFIATAKPSGKPIKILALGKPGLGKSALSSFLCTLLTKERWNISRLNGKQLDIGQMEQLAFDLRLTSMYPGYRIVQIEEIDRMSRDAQVRALTVLDDLPKQTAVIGTSNCEVGEFEERFQRRFKVAELAPPKSEEIQKLLLKLGVSTEAARRLSFSCGGNVGQALEDADLYCIEQNHKAVAA